MEKQLYRYRTDRHISGVCGGIGEYFDINSDFARLLFIISGVSGVIVYMFMKNYVPEAPE